MASNAAASLLAYDDASDAAYADGWQSGDNGGFGWGGGWTFRNGGNSVIPQPDPPTASFQGTFVNSSLGNNNPGGSDGNGDNDIDTGGKAWGVYANTANELYAIRPLNGALAVGQILKFSFDNGNVDSTRVLGVRLLANASDISTRQFEVRHVGGDSFYTVIHNTGSSTITSTLGFSREGIDAEFQLTTPTTFSVKLTRRENGSTQTINGTLVQPGGNIQVNAIALRNLSAGSGATNNGYLNSISVPEPASLGVIALGAVAIRRKRV